MTNEHATQEIVENFLDVLRSEYKHAKSTRGEQFAEWHHFRKEYLNRASDEQKFEVFAFVYREIGVKELNKFSMWLPQLFGSSIPYKTLVFDVINGNYSNEKKIYIAKWLIDRLDTIPHEVDLIRLTDDEKKLLETYGYKGRC